MKIMIATFIPNSVKDKGVLKKWCLIKLIISIKQKIKNSDD